jgi:hypothetical protein
MRRAIWTSFLVGLLAVTAWAQDEGDRGQRRGDRPQGDRRPRQERGPGDRRGGERGPGMDRMWERVVDELQLDEEQRARFDEIVAKYRERGQEMGQRWREMRDEMRKAREAGDEERMRELRDEMRQGRTEPDSGLSEALEELEPILREDQIAKLWELQDQMQSRRQDRDRYRRIMEDLPDELGLSDEQRNEYDELLRAQREERRERFSGIRPLMEELRQAREAGDEARVQELQQQLEQSRPGPETMFEGFFEDLASILTEEQVERLAAFRKSLEEGDGGTSGDAGNVRNVLRAAKRLKLDADQKEEIRQIEQEAIRAYREIPRSNKEEHATLAAEVKAEIVKVLDKTQAEEFETALKRLDRGRPAERRDRDRDRGGRRGERQP